MKKLYLILALFGSATVMAETVVIVHPSNTAALDSDTIARIFLGRDKSFPDGASALPVALIEGVPATEEFNSKILKKSSSQLKAYWSKLVFTGKGSPPKEADSDTESVKLVGTNPSLIGYVDASAVNDSVKVVLKF